MCRVVSYVRRHRAQEPEEDVEDSRWRYSLMSALDVAGLLSLRPDNAKDTLEIDAATRAAVIEHIDYLGGTERKDHP